MTCSAFIREAASCRKWGLTQIPTTRKCAESGWFWSTKYSIRFLTSVVRELWGRGNGKIIRVRGMEDTKKTEHSRIHDHLKNLLSIISKFHKSQLLMWFFSEEQNLYMLLSSSYFNREFKCISGFCPCSLRICPCQRPLMTAVFSH